MVGFDGRRPGVPRPCLDLPPAPHMPLKRKKRRDAPSVGGPR